MEKPTHTLIYKGSIAEAINEARRQKKLFVVYISGEDENSILMEQSTWVDQNVHETILRYCVFLHLIEGSVDASQFSAIYPQNAIPSISAIAGLNGVRLWHQEGFISADNLKENIEKCCATYHLQETAATLLATAALATSNPQQVRPASQTEIQSPDDVTPASSSNPKPVEITNESPKNDDVTTSSSSNPKSTDTLQKEKKNKTKMPAQKDKSPENDDVLAGVISANSSNPKLNETSSNETKSKTRTPTQNDEPHKNNDISTDVTMASSSSKPKSNEVCVNVRLPDGKSLQMKLNKSDALRFVRDFVDGNLVGVGFGKYDLGVPYPRKIFNEQDMERTLSELGFANREALIVIPHQSARAKPSIHTNSNTNREISNEYNNEGYFGYLRRVISYVNPFSYLRGNSEPSNQSANTEHPFAQRVMSQQTGQSQQDDQTSRNRTGTSTGTRPFGSNIHTLRRDNEGSDNNNRNMFWNGNSTQFGGDNGNNK